MQSLLQKIYQKIPLSLILFFTLLPFGNFFFRGMDLWHGVGMYVQIGVLAIFSLSLFKYNKPLGLLTFWLGLLTSIIWYEVFQKTNNYAIKIFLPFFNFLTIVILYKLIVEYINTEYLEKIFRYLSYSLLIILFYCVLQYFNLDQFFKHYSVAGAKDQMVGTIGNQSHLAGFLALIIPFFFNNIYALILIGLLITLCNSASGIIIGISIILFYLFHTHRQRFYGVLSGSIMCMIMGFIFFRNFFSFEGRLELWKRVYQVFTEKPITGQGLGTFSLMQIKLLPNETIWRHVHNELYQLALEAGLIGLFLAIWCIYDYFRTFTVFKTSLTIKLASIFFGFCILCLFSFPCHLWLISIIGLLSYAGVYIIKKESLKCEPV